MPKGISYTGASKVAAFRRKKSKDEKHLKKKDKKTKRTEDVEKRLRDAGFTEEDIKRLRGKK